MMIAGRPCFGTSSGRATEAVTESDGQDSVAVGGLDDQSPRDSETAVALALQQPEASSSAPSPSQSLSAGTARPAAD